MTRIVTALSAVLLATQMAFGQCRTFVHNQPVCVTPIVATQVVTEVVTPIAVPVLVPATVFQYLPALQPVVTPIAVAPVAAAPVAVSPAPTTADVDSMIRARVDVILREHLNNNDAGPPTLIVPTDLPSLPQQPTAAPVVTGDLNQRVATLLGSKSCVNCHTAGTGSPVKGNVTLFTRRDNQTFFQPSVAKTQIVAAVTPSVPNTQPNMPPNGAPLVQHELDLLRQWSEQR